MFAFRERSTFYLSQLIEDQTIDFIYLSMASTFFQASRGMTVLNPFSQISIEFQISFNFFLCILLKRKVAHAKCMTCCSDSGQYQIDDVIII